MLKLSVSSSLVLVFMFGCGAHAPAPKLYRYADLAHQSDVSRAAFDKPLILEFNPGDRLPIDLALHDEYLALDPATPELALVVKERCYVRVDDQGIRLSRDLRGFDRDEKAPGSFAIGLDRNAAGPLLRVQVHTPRR